MDMMTRSAVLAAILVTVAIAATAGWWFFNGGVVNPPNPPADFGQTRQYGDVEGSLFDEFGDDPFNDTSPDDRIIIRTGSQLDIPAPPTGTVAGLPSGPQFGWGQPPTTQSGQARLPVSPMPRTTPAERVEADCRARGGGSYACRCLVRMARSALTAEEFDFLSLAEEADPRPERLSTTGLALTDLPAVTVKLVALDANARRRCGSGLKP